jgi:lactoylglutathione lyase
MAGSVKVCGYEEMPADKPLSGKRVASGMKQLRFAIACLVLAFITEGISAQQKASLNHIALYVTNLERSTVFYREVVGLDTIPEPFHDGLHTWFGVGPKSHLHLIQAGSQRFEHNKNTHLCFTVQDVPAFARMLASRGIAFEDWPGAKGKITTRVDGVRQLYLQDPDGFWLEINDARQ